MCSQDLYLSTAWFWRRTSSNLCPPLNSRKQLLSKQSFSKMKVTRKFARSGSDNNGFVVEDVTTSLYNEAQVFQEGRAYSTY